MLITPSALDAAFLTFDKRFQGAYQAAESWYAKVASIVPSSSSQVNYAWMDRLPALREWLGARQVQNAIAQGYTLVNKKFEATVGIGRDKFEDDQLEVFAMIPEELGNQAKTWPDKLLTTVIEAGNATTTFDNQYFFDTDHPTDTAVSGSTSQANLFSYALSANNLSIVRAAMKNFKGRDGKPLGINPRLLMVPPALESTALQIANAEFIAPAGAIGQNSAGVVQTNILRGSFDVLVNPYLTSATAWYLFDTSRAIKPFVWQLRNAPEFVWKNRPDDDNVFMMDEFLYGVRARGNAGFGLWFLAAMSTP